MEELNSISLSETQRKLIEKLGDIGNKEGLSPSCSRITALLMISDKTELTFDEIRTTLKLSKSATSNAINTLLQKRSIEYVTHIGDRKRYFRSNIESWKNLFSEQFSKLIYLNELLKEISEVRTTDTKEFNTALNQLIDFMTYFLQEIPKIFEKWEEKN